MKYEDFDGSFNYEDMPIESLIEALESLISYLMENTGLDRQSLSDHIKNLVDLLGEEECMNLDIDQTVDWINSLK